jgi:hypothetical protein
MPRRPGRFEDVLADGADVAGATWRGGAAATLRAGWAGAALRRRDLIAASHLPSAPPAGWIKLAFARGQAE